MNEDMAENEIKPEEMDFITWLAEVDQSTWLTTGCSIHDLPDCTLRDWYEEGMNAGDAAARAIKGNFPALQRLLPPVYYGVSPLRALPKNKLEE